MFLCIYCTLSTVQSMLHATWYMSNCPHMMPALNFITRLFMCSFSTTFFLPPGIFMIRTKAGEKPDQDSCLSTTFMASEKGQGPLSIGEKTVEAGLERWRWTMQEGGCQVLWSGILLPTPTTTESLFLPAMHCSVHLSHYEPRLLKEAGQNNETMRLCRKAVQASE